MIKFVSFRYRKAIFKTLQRTCFFASFFNVVSVILALSSAEMQVQKVTNFYRGATNSTLDSSNLYKVVRGSTSLCVILNIIFSIQYHFSNVQIFKFGHGVSPTCRYVPTSMIVSAVIEVIILLIHPVSFGFALEHWTDFISHPYLYFAMLFRLVYRVFSKEIEI